MHGYIGGKRGHVTFSSRISSEGLMNITAADVDIMAAGEFGGKGIMIDDDSQVNIMGDGVAEGQRGHVKFTSPRRQPRRVYHLRRRMSFGSVPCSVDMGSSWLYGFV